MLFCCKICFTFFGEQSLKYSVNLLLTYIVYSNTRDSCLIRTVCKLYSMLLLIMDIFIFPWLCQRCAVAFCLSRDVSCINLMELLSLELDV